MKLFIVFFLMSLVAILLPAKSQALPRCPPFHDEIEDEMASNYEDVKSCFSAVHEPLSAAVAMKICQSGKDSLMGKEDGLMLAVECVNAVFAEFGKVKKNSDRVQSVCGGIGSFKTKTAALKSIESAKICMKQAKKGRAIAAEELQSRCNVQQVADQ